MARKQVTKTTAKKPTTRSKRGPKTVEALSHDEAKRSYIPTAEFQSVLDKQEQSPIRVAYERRNRDLDPQLVWRGKDQQDWSDLIVQVPPLFIQEKVHPKVLVDDLVRETKRRVGGRAGRPAAGPVRRLQRPAGRGGHHRLLPARRELDQPDDSG